MTDVAPKTFVPITTLGISSHSRLGRHGYRAAMVLIAITIVAACLAIWDLHSGRISDVRQEANNLTVVLAEQTARAFQAIDLVMRETQGMVQASGISDPNEFKQRIATAEVHNFLTERLRSLPQADAISLIDDTGTIVNFSRSWPVPTIDTSDRDFYAYWRAHDEPGLFIGKPVINKVTGAWVLTVTRRINGPRHEFLGIVLIVIQASYFEDFYKAIKTSGGESITLFRRDGVLLARYPRVESAIGEKLASESPWYGVVAAGGGTYLTPGYVDGVPRIISVQPVSDYPLAITIGIPKDVALAPWRRQATIIAVGAVGAIVGFAILFWVLGVQFRRIERSETRFRGFATTSSDWFWETDEHHRISYMSEGVSTTGFGVSPNHLFGRTRMEIAADAGGETEKWAEHFSVLERHEPFRDFRYKWSNPGGQGTASISGDPLFDDKGRFLGYRGTGRDVTALMTAEAQLRQTQEDLNRAQRLAKVGSDVWDLRTGHVEWSAEMYRIFGVDPASYIPTTENFFDLIAPEDRPNLLARRKKILQGKCPSACQFSIRRPDGRVRHIYSEAELVLDESGKPARWVGMRQDITERTRAERSLREAKEAAETANIAKSQFLATVSHELRTPLNAIIGFSEMVEQGLAGPVQPRQLEYTKLVLQSGRHLLDVINDILDLARVDSGKFELGEEEGVDIAQAIDACIMLTNHRAEAAGVALSSEIEDELPRIVADLTRLKQILLNLISNAIRFTNREGSVVVAARRIAAGGIEFEVRDTGIGMAPNEIAIALEPFGQVDAQLARAHEGTGLGLPIARRLAELHGGSLHVESEKGRGTIVTVVFPASRVMTSSVETVEGNRPLTPVQSH
jgi:PAS domain S-box-containing protein